MPETSTQQPANSMFPQVLLPLPPLPPLMPLLLLVLTFIFNYYINIFILCFFLCNMHTYLNEQPPQLLNQLSPRSQSTRQE